MGRLLNPIFRGTLALLFAGIAVLSIVRSVSAYEVHIVSPGETLGQIAARYGTTVARLQRLNNLNNANFVWHGQRLLIDSDSPAPSATGDQGGQNVRQYRVRAGESLSVIARRHGISLAQLARMNGLSPYRWLYSGQVLLVPGSAAPVQAAPNPVSQAGAANQNAGSDQNYTVRPGDSLTGLARRYGVSLTQLLSMNGLTTARWLYVGQVLKVPGALGSSGQPAPSAPALQPEPPAPALQPAPVERPERPQTVIHLVQPGEFLSSIAERYGIDQAVLARVNGLGSPNLLREGQTLRIPSDGALELINELYPRLDPVRYPTLTERWVEIDLSEQLAVAYEGTIPVKVFVISSGVGNTPTVTGTFRIWAKIAMQDMQGGNRAAGNYYHLKDVRNVQYFYKNYGLHGTYWHDNFGSPMSRGCVNMTEEDAEWLFDWTSPAVYTDDWLFSTASNPGTIVMVHH